MRQAQATISSFVSARVSQINAVAERIDPMGDPNCGIAAANARFGPVSCSVATNTAPPHSPPSEMPWSRRSSTKMAPPIHPACS
ncbi:MAG: Uncharacterised protein [Cellulomonadaceae bacterium TMED98]|nr:MAG: Uncharacterised protein [Cellulomonadaceae bacterium TMED98]